MTSKNIILLHGWGASTSKLEPLANELRKKKWNVFVPEIPGFDADPPPQGWFVDDYVNYIADKANKKWNGKAYYVFGHSNGGRIGIKLALKSSSLKGLILCATGGISRGNVFKRIVFFILAKLGKAFLIIMPLAKMWKKMLYKVAREHDYEKTSGVMRETFQNIVKEDLKPLIASISVPTLVLWGENDQMTPLNDAYFIATHLQKGKLKVYKDEGHTLPYKRYRELADEITNYFR